MIQLFFIGVLLHIIDDFVLQPICLSKLKQKIYWKEYGDLYKHDYICALIIHGLSWSIMTSLPLIVYINSPILYILIIINAFIHSFIDNEKANDENLTLTQDQILHFLQIIALYCIVGYDCLI